jgi:transcriptional regulator with XRE-family HTH domain
MAINKPPEATLPGATQTSTPPRPSTANKGLLARPRVTPPTRINFGDAIRQLRERKKLRQEDVAREVETSQGYFSKIETNNADCSISLLERIAETLDVRLYQLFALAEGVAPERLPRITVDETELLAEYRQLPPEGKNMVKAVVNTLIAPSKPTTRK